MDCAVFGLYSGRGAFYACKLDRKDRWWGHRSEYVGISNEKTGEIPVRRNPKGSARKVYPLRVSRNPKPRPVGVGDGKQVKYSCTTLSVDRWGDAGR